MERILIRTVAVPNGQNYRYKLYLYNEASVDSRDGIPILFIHGSGGSYKQVRSIAKESHRAFIEEPPESSYIVNISGYLSNNKYKQNLIWFSVDLNDEQSAADLPILEDQIEYVVTCVHRILDYYIEVFGGVGGSINLPESVILVGHSVGGFVARAAAVHPRVKKFAIQTIVYLASAHQSPPISLQPSLGWYYAKVNKKWREGYETGLLSNVIVISISGGFNDYLVRTSLESLDNIVPPSHGFMISSTSMKNVWLPLEHQVIVCCNQLVMQVSHTLLSLVDPTTGQPFYDSQRRLAVFANMLQTGVAPNFNWMKQTQSSPAGSDDGASSAVSQVQSVYACPKNVHWGDDGPQKELYIQTKTVTVLAKDGCRRWLDIKKLGTKGSHFVLVTSLPPCHGVKVHLWSDNSTSKINLEMTSKMVQIGKDNNMFWLSPMDMERYKYITISVVLAQTISGTGAPMAVGQFFNSKDGNFELSQVSLLHSLFTKQSMEFKEEHSLALNISFTISLGMLPVTLSMRTTGCENKKEVGDAENGICTLGCFPPIALAWDSLSGLHVYPNLRSEMFVVDSAPAFWTFVHGSDKTTVMLLVDPHCSFKISYNADLVSLATRFMLLYYVKIAGLSLSAVFSALWMQALNHEHDSPLPKLAMGL